MRIGALACLLFLVACNPVLAVDFRQQQVLYFQDSNGVRVGDFNEDGRDDLSMIYPLWVVDHYESHFKVVLQDVGGVFPGVTYDLKSPVNFLMSLSVADVDGDGDDDLVMGHSQGVLTARWNGSGFDFANTAGTIECLYAAGGDMDGDDAIDLACRDHDQLIEIYLNDKTGGFQTPAMIQAPTRGDAGYRTPFTLDIGDVTGDGLADLVVSPGGTFANFFVYSNNGTGSFLPPVTYPLPLYGLIGPAAVRIADLDLDGANEIILGTTTYDFSLAHEMQVYRRGIHGYMEPWQALDRESSITGMQLDDLDGDGDLDIFVGDSSSVGWYMNDAGLLRAQTSQFAYPNWFSGNFTAGDLNSDGHRDLVIASNHSGLMIHWGMRRPRSDFGSAQTPYGADFRSDVFFRNPTTGQNVVWLAANYTTPKSVQGLSTDWRVAAKGRFDSSIYEYADGVFWRNSKTGANAIWNRAEASTVRLMTTITNMDWDVAGAGDFDGDNVDDVLWHNNATGANVYWKGGDYAKQQNLTTVTDTAWQIRGIGDFNGDDIADILWRHATYGSNAIWLSGKNATAQAIARLADPAWQVAGIGDFNGDNRDDILWRNAANGANAIWRSGNLSTPQAVQPVGLQWRVAAIGDYDGDGRSDVFWSNTSGANVIWRSANTATPQAVAGVASGWRAVP